MMHCVQNFEGFLENHIVHTFLEAQSPGKGEFPQSCMNLKKKKIKIEKAFSLTLF